MSTQVGQQLLRCRKTLVTGTPHGHPVTGVRQGLVGEHEAVGVEGVGQRGGAAGRQGVGVQGMKVMGGVNQGETGFEGGGIVDTGGAIISSQVVRIGVGHAVGVPA